MKVRLELKKQSWRTIIAGKWKRQTYFVELIVCDKATGNCLYKSFVQIFALVKVQKNKQIWAIIIHNAES